MGFDEDGLSIPRMTDPLGRHWQQPDRDSIELDKTHALMSEATFGKLLDYSRSVPSGVYSGKMWKGQCRGVWFLCWFGGPSSEPGEVWTHHREILIA